MLQCQVRDGGVVLPASLEQFSDCMAMAADALRQPLNSSDKQEIEDFVLVIYKSTLKSEYSQASTNSTAGADNKKIPLLFTIAPRP